MKISKRELRQIIIQEVTESLGTSVARFQTARQMADALKDLETLMKELLKQKMSAVPGSEQHDRAQERLVRLAAVVDKYVSTLGAQ